MYSPQFLFVHPFLSQMEIDTEEDPLFSPLDSLEQYYLLETAENSDHLKQLLTDTEYDPFIAAVILQGVYIREHRLKDAVTIQIQWQNRLDKFKRTPVLDFYIGRFFFHQGQCYHLMTEYEVAAALFSKSRKYFLSISFNWAVIYLNYAIAQSFILLGASGDVRYHYREILRNSEHPALITRIAILLSQSYLNSGLLKKARTIIEETKKQISGDLLVQLDKQLENLTSRSY